MHLQDISCVTMCDFAILTAAVNTARTQTGNSARGKEGEMTARRALNILRVAASAGLICAVLTGAVGLDELQQWIASGVGAGGAVAWKLAHLA